MLYKDLKQQENKDKLLRLLEENNYPEEIADFFSYSSVKSNQALLGYFSSINKFLIWCRENKIIDSFQVNNIKPSHVVKYLTGLLEEENYKNSSIITIQNELSSFFSYLLDEGLVNRNPVLKRNKKLFAVKTAKNTKKLPMPNDLIELESNLRKIPNRISNIKFNSIYRVLKGSGLREIELVGLDLDDLHLDVEYPYISILRKGRYQEIEKEKIIISNDAKLALLQWLEVRDMLQPKCNAVYLTRSGDRIREQNIIKCLKKYSDGKITPHMLRHLYVTNLYQQTNDLAFVQEQCGHVNGSNVTLDVYAAGSEEAKRVALNI